MPVRNPNYIIIPPALYKFFSKSWGRWGRAISFAVLSVVFCLSLHGQFVDRFSGSVSLTNNGISPVPSFTLNDPALITEMSIAKGRFSFDPVFRFNVTNGQAWSFDFPIVWKAVEEDSFRFTLGLEHSMNFVNRVVESDSGDSIEIIENWRFLGLEVGPTVILTEQWEVGFFYFGVVGFDTGPDSLHFLSMSTRVSDIRITRNLYLALQPQIFHLRVDEEEGYYTCFTAWLSFGDSPFSFRFLANKSLGSEIDPTQNVIWNATVSFSFE